MALKKCMAGSGVKSLTLDITKGKHEFGEFDVDALGKRNRARLIAEAEGDSEKFSGE